MLYFLMIIKLINYLIITFNQSVDASMRSPVTVTGWYQADDRCSGDRRGRAGGLQKIYLGVTCHRRVIQ